jgi:hypothetical protein
MLAWSGTVAVIASVIVVFVIGEMFWLLTSQAVTTRLAPSELPGIYFGILAAMTGPAWTLAPLVSLQMRAHVDVAAV